MRFFKVVDGRLLRVAYREEASEVMMTIPEMEELERRVKNKTEEAERWRKRVTGEGATWTITRRVFNSNHSYAWSLYLSVPLPHSPDLFQEAQRIAKRYFEEYMNRGYTLQYTAGAGWILGMYLTAQEYDFFKTS